MDFKTRSYKKELLDEENIQRNDLFQNLRELSFINTYLGGHAVTVKGLSKMITDKNKSYSILDIGSGGGDTLKYVAKWGRKNNYNLQLTGVDLKQDCVDYAENFCKDFSEITFHKSDYRNLQHLNNKYDIIITSLFCHHLNDNELVDLFSWCNAQAQIAFLMNDLHRHPLAYYSISFLTKLFSKSYLVKNDAKLSVLRGFKKQELISLISKSTIVNYQLKWRWAFRWLVIVKTY